MEEKMASFSATNTSNTYSGVTAELQKSAVIPLSFRCHSTIIPLSVCIWTVDVFFLINNWLYMFILFWFKKVCTFGGSYILKPKLALFFTLVEMCRHSNFVFVCPIKHEKSPIKSKYWIKIAEIFITAKNILVCWKLFQCFQYLVEIFDWDSSIK